MPPGGTHGKRALRIGSRIASFVEHHGLGEAVGEAGFRLLRDPDTVLAPDAAFIAKDALAGAELPETYIDAVPRLVVEVVSPNDRRAEVLQKVGTYLDCGVARVWVVREKDHTVIVYGQDDEITVVPSDGTLTSGHAGFEIPGFELPVAAIFE